MIGDFIWTMANGSCLTDEQMAQVLEDFICDDKFCVGVRIRERSIALHVEISVDQTSEPLMSRIKSLYEACKDSTWSEGRSLRFMVFELCKEFIAE